VLDRFTTCDIQCIREEVRVIGKLLGGDPVMKTGGATASSTPKIASASVSSISEKPVANGFA